MTGLPPHSHHPPSPLSPFPLFPLGVSSQSQAQNALSQSAISPSLAYHPQSQPHQHAHHHHGPARHQESEGELSDNEAGGLSRASSVGPAAPTHFGLGVGLSSSLSSIASGKRNADTMMELDSTTSSPALPSTSKLTTSSLSTAPAAARRSSSASSVASSSSSHSSNSHPHETFDLGSSLADLSSLVGGFGVDSDSREDGDPHDPANGAGLGGVGAGAGLGPEMWRRGPPDADTPGGDCKSVCVRHQRMANGGTNGTLQKSIETLPLNDQNVVNTIWSLFSSSPHRRRLLILRGLLTIACPSQLTFLQDSLTLEMRLDPLEILPHEVGLKVFSYLDAISLGRAAQVSRKWKEVADDDLLWRNMCEQHIERKCEKCGWGLPLLGERRRKSKKDIKEKEKEKKVVVPPSPVASEDATVSRVGPELDVTMSGIRPQKRAKTHSPSASRSSTPSGNRSPAIASSSALPGSTTNTPPPAIPMTTAKTTRPWKLVYCERLAIERNWRKGTCVATVLQGHTDSITCLQVSEDLPHPNFPLLMTGSWDRSVRIWNLETGTEVGILRGHSRGIRALQFDAVKLVTGSMDSTLKIWNWRTGECMRTLRGHRDAVICLTYDKQLLVSGSADSTIRVWDFGTGEVYTLLGHSEWVNSVAIWNSNDDGCDPTLKAKDGDLGKPTSDPEQAKASAKGKFLISASDDMTIRVWDLYTRECVRVLKGHVAQVQSLRVTNRTEVTAPAFPTTALNSDSPDPSSSSASNPLNNRHQVVVGNQYGGFFDNSPALSSTASPAIGAPIAGGAPPAAVWNRQAAMPDPDASNLPDIDWGTTTNRPTIVSSSLDNTIKVWDVEMGVCQRTMFGHVEGVWDVDVDKLRIVSGSHDRTLKIWDRESGRCLHTLVGHKSAVTVVNLQDQYVVTGSDDASVRIWDFAKTERGK